MIPWNHSSPETHIGIQISASSSFTFHLEICNSSSGGYGIKGHIDDCRHTAGHCSLSAGTETFPVRSSWFIQVDVGTS